MRNVKLVLGTNSQFGIPTSEQIKLFKKVGFEGFFTEWNATDHDTAEYRRLADELGLLYQSIHAPYGRSADMWRSGEVAETAVNELISCLRDCAKYSVPVMIAHAFIGFKDHTPTKEGIVNYGRVVDEAERLGVKIAFENTEGEEYLDCLMEHFKDRECVGFCWDTGHEMCYNRHRDMLASYGDRLIATHLNDNLGVKDFGGEITYIDDLHLLPFDGIADWKGITDRLEKYGFDGVLTFELNTKSKPGRHENDAYDRMSIEEYVTEAYKRACRVGAMYAYRKNS